VKQVPEQQPIKRLLPLNNQTLFARGSQSREKWEPAFGWPVLREVKRAVLGDGGFEHGVAFLVFLACVTESK
jgi:hypothetical protein